MPDATIIPLQSPLPQVLPTIEGNVDYRNLREQFQRIDQLLRQSGLERDFIQSDLDRWSQGQQRVSARAQHTRQIHSQRALRCNPARSLLHEDYRGFAARLADSPLLQHFCLLSQLTVRVPSKSTLQRYDQWWKESQVAATIHQFLVLGAQDPGRLDLDQALDLNCCFLDTTCVEVNIHYPVDWVLLRDGTRTLMKAVSLIREQGLKQRMEEPEVFISRVNKLCIQMTHAWNHVDGQKQRKRTLRKMDRVVGTVRRHAQRYRDLLDEQWEQTQWTRAQADQVLGRMDQVLQQLPQARRQARERILAGRQFDNLDNRQGMADDGIYNGVCPRSPKALKARMRSPKFRKLQRRRAQTEARIGIIKNIFLRGRPRCKGFINRKLTITWTVLVHNLWVIARLPRKAATKAAAA